MQFILLWLCFICLSLFLSEFFNEYLYPASFVIGTLGYVMSELEDGRPLSQVVRAAKTLGYTEPGLFQFHLVIMAHTVSCFLWLIVNGILLAALYLLSRHRFFFAFLLCSIICSVDWQYAQTCFVLIIDLVLGEPTPNRWKEKSRLNTLNMMFDWHVLSIVFFFTDPRDDLSGMDVARKVRTYRYCVSCAFLPFIGRDCFFQLIFLYRKRQPWFVYCGH